MEQNKVGPQTAEWWVKRIADSCIRDRIMATNYYRNNKTNKYDSLCWALNDVVSRDEILDIRVKYFSPDHTTASHTDWVKEEAKLLPIGEPQQDLRVDKLIGTPTAIHCPTKKEWDTVYGLLKKTGKYAASIEDCWKNYQEKSCIICNSTYDRIVYCQSQSYPVVQAKDVIAANLPSTGYKVGDWITVLDGGCRVGPGIQGHKLIGNSYRISSVDRQTPTEWKYTLEGNPAQTSAISWNKNYIGSQPYIRLATPEEIAKATGTPLPTESKEWVCTSEDGVELYAGDSPVWVNIGANVIHSSCLLKKHHIGTSIGEGMPYKVFSTEQAAKEWIARQSTSQVPVTADNAYVGMKVVRGKYWLYDNQDGGVGCVGEIKEIRSNKWCDVKWPHGSKRDYPIGSENKYALYIAPEEKSTSKSIINSQTKTKTNSYEESSNNTGTAVKLSANSSTVCRADRGTATSVRQSGQPLITIRGHRSNGQGLRLS